MAGASRGVFWLDSLPQPLRSRLPRRPQRGHYDAATVYRVLDAAVIAHVGYIIDGQPFVTPTAFWREEDVLFWHGSAASRMLRVQAERIPVSLTVTHFDGFVLARSGFNHSLCYRSVMAFGEAAPVEDAAEKRRVLDAFVERLFPGRTRDIRQPTEQELKATSVMSVRIEEAVAKIRDGGVHDDEADYALPCWAGVIAVTMRVGRIAPDDRLAPGTPIPAGLAPYEEGAPLDAVLTETARRPY
jgi:nitroimidazol reductase NimA-like FMN-containing flavoprotein (pyridoxamine 5'-phosphate oxidase superfamily)